MLRFWLLSASGFVIIAVCENGERVLTHEALHGALREREIERDVPIMVHLTFLAGPRARSSGARASITRSL